MVVVGDLIADEYLYGKPARVSREAPVLILRFREREVRLGGAANAAHNVHALGAEAVAVGLLGTDSAGDEVDALFRRVGMATAGLIRVPDRPTPVKTRIMAGGISPRASRWCGSTGSRRPVSPRMPRRTSSRASRPRAPGPRRSWFRTMGTAR